MTSRRVSGPSLRHTVYLWVIPVMVVLAASCLVSAFILTRDGKWGAGEIILTLFGFAAVLGLYTALMLERSVLNPLATLARRVRAIRVNPELSTEVTAEGCAEFSLLAEEINRLLRELSESERTLAYRHREAKERADRDPTTGLLNHRAIVRELDRAVAGAERDGGELSLVLMDIDGFRLFNETYGHLVGDDIITWVGRVLRGCSRASDPLGRYGADEFLIILRGGPEEALAYCERVRFVLAAQTPHVTDLETIPITLSFGVATYPDSGRQAQELLVSADASLYRCKDLGGDSISMVSLCHQSLPRQPSQFDTLQALITAVDRKDHYTLRHSEQVATYAVRLARASGLGADEQHILRTAGILHDVGKICIPESLLRKPGKLTRDEKSVVDFHVAFGAKLIHDVPDEEQVRVAVAAHHERWDGLGYPSELEGENIPLLGRVLAVADTYSALTTKRPYRNALDPPEAQRVLTTLLGTQLDPTLGRLFVESCLGQDEADDDITFSIFSFPPSCGNCINADICERAQPANMDLTNVVRFPGAKRPSM